MQGEFLRADGDHKLGTTVIWSCHYALTGR